MDETFDLKITATPEQIGSAVMGALLATVTTLYFMQLSTIAAAQSGATAAHAISTGDIEKFETPDRSMKGLPVESRRTCLAFAYDTVIKSLPIDSPFREPLTKRRDVKVAALKD